MTRAPPPWSGWPGSPRRQGGLTGLLRSAPTPRVAGTPGDPRRRSDAAYGPERPRPPPGHRPGPGRPRARRRTPAPVDWAAVTARYREGLADEPRDAWLLAQHSQLPEELPPLLIDAHPKLFSSYHPDTRWKFDAAVADVRT
ncbi:hypothetical protein O1L68_43865 [Streptomyces lydicus]|nr:hypothetical protein [Streptomyces lydicus]